jgi:peptide/nickel transport system substrate-binding protein
VGVLLASLSLGCGSGRDSEPLVIAFPDRPATLDPHFHNNNITWSVVLNFYDALVAFSPRMELEPALATSWQQPTPTTWRFELRRGVVFDNGDPFTAADVVASLERVRTRPRAALAFHFAAVREVVAEGTHAVLLITERPIPDLVNRLAFVPIIPRRLTTLSSLDKPVGTGPYSFAGRTKDGAVLARARKSWRGDPEIKSVRFEFFTDPDMAVAGLLSGHVDICHLLPPHAVAQVERTPGLRALIQPRIGVQLLALYPKNAQGPARAALADRRVRRAMLAGLDRARWVDTLFQGNGTVATQFVHPVVFGYDPSLEPQSFEPAEARRALQDAGYPDGIAVTLGHSAGSADLAKAIAHDLERIGVHVTLLEGPASAMPRLVTDATISLQVFSWACATGDATDLFDQFILPPASIGIRSLRYWGFSYPPVDRLLEQAARAPNADQRLLLLQGAQRRLVEELPIIPLTVRWSHVGVSDRVDVVPRYDERHWAADFHWRK